MGASRLRRGILSIVFGLSVAQGLLQPQDAAAQTAAPASEADPQTAASRDLESMRLYYAQHAQGGVVLGVIDTDRVFIADTTLSNTDILRAALTNNTVMPDDNALTEMAEAIDLLPSP